MSTKTPNYDLNIPEDTDSMDSFFDDYEENMNIIDNNLGGGGGSGSGTNIYGAFIDTDNSTAIIINDGSVTHSTYSYTATEDCFADILIQGNSSATIFVKIDGEVIYQHIQTPVFLTDIVPLRKGQEISFENLTAYSYLTIYGVKQGTQNIYAPVIYSDTERKVGVWRDNKPLYQKTLVIEHLNLVTSGTRVDISSLGVDMCGAVMSASYYIVSGVKRDFVRIDYQEPDDLYLFVSTQRNDTTCYVTIRYTKTADVAGSGDWNTDGVPTHHYDGNEKVVGTWFGETLYEKSFTPTLVRGSNTITHGISNFGDLISVSGSCRYNNQNKSLPLPYVSTNSAYMILVGDVTPTDFNINVGTSFSSIEDAKLTIQYTKTA